MSDPPPRLIGGRYLLLDELGRGGMGVVWRARDEVLGRPVALKQVLLPDWVVGKEREQAFERVLREARAAARLRHPGVVTIHDVVHEEGSPWIVMELLPAESLHDVVERWGPLTEEVAVEIGLKLLDALHAAHSHGITHRDVKPGNVLLLDDGGVVLTDFGVAHVADSPTITGTGMLLGSPAFMAPERLEGKPATAASDLWSLGATLYTAVEGAPPYRGPTPVAVLASILMAEPRPMRNVKRLRRVIEGLMTRDPDARMGYGEAHAALVAAGAHPEVTGSRALAELVRWADEADARAAGGEHARPSEPSAPGGRGLGAMAGPEPDDTLHDRELGAVREHDEYGERGKHGGRGEYGDHGDHGDHGGRGQYGDHGERSDYGERAEYGVRDEYDEYGERGGRGGAVAEHGGAVAPARPWVAPLRRTIILLAAAMTALGTIVGSGLGRDRLPSMLSSVLPSALQSAAGGRLVMAAGLTLAALAIPATLLAAGPLAAAVLRVLPLAVLYAAVNRSTPEAGAYVLLTVWTGAVAAATWRPSRPAALVAGVGTVAFALAALAAGRLGALGIAGWAATVAWMIWAAGRTR
ncbi:serine/threonine-protein kinase [Thermoactinospora rubra]|uniref:serine/threonine-protein kinase n=1 Tax=Thermoactinospora rubra TaxID=1088767 RepID=UPI000A10F3E5|nr:serine/threonine-protein kinase [Thermoactinospora rubra]